MATGARQQGEREGAEESLLIAGGNCEHGTEEQLHVAGSVRRGMGRNLEVRLL